MWLAIGGIGLVSVSAAFVIVVIVIWRTAIKERCGVSLIFGLVWPWLGLFALSLVWTGYLSLFGIDTGHPLFR